MKNTMKYLLILILMLGITGEAANIFAQTGGKILVSAGGKTLKQSDVDEIIKFYEWAFQTEFTSEQRSEFRRIKEAQFRNDPAETESGNNTVKGFLPKVSGKSESEQAKLRQAFNDSFIADLRKFPEEAEAKFLISIYDGAGGDTTMADNEQENADDSSFGGNLGSVAGKWVWQNSGSGTWNSTTGAYMGGSGTRVTYQFSTNGEVSYSGITNVMMGGCSQQVFLTQKGRASLSGNTMTIKWSPGTSTRDFSCDKANNYTKTAPAVTETLAISFKTNSTGQKLFCMKSGGGETCYSPTK